MKNQASRSFGNDLFNGYEHFGESSAQISEFTYDNPDDFGPLLSSSPDVHRGSASVPSTPPTTSFAQMAVSGTHSLSSSWKRPEMIEETGWRLEIPDSSFSPSPDANGRRKKKGKKILLVGNGGARGRG